ncbi:MAG TPA: acyl carrier protein [Acidimicrobiia bacterium]|jgi:acyl carrier protein|nr:acyl carrier protein [Acidimicrobiia bacterium]
MADIKASIKDYILEEFVPDGDIDVEDNTNLLEEEVVDSLGIFTLVSFIENKFSVSIDAEEVNLDNFETLESITKLVESKLG